MTNSESSFLKNIIKEVGGEYTLLAQDIEEDESYVDTGSLILNALISGTLFGGVSSNKITTFSGDQGSGKTFFSLSVVKNFLDTNSDGYCWYFDTESAVTQKMLVEKGVDVSRVVVDGVVTIEEFRTRALNAVDIVVKKGGKWLFVLDSLGMLSTKKELEDGLSGSDKVDMTRAKLAKAAFRMLTLKLGKSNIPMIVTNHVYSNTSGMGDTYSKVQSGGTGMQYAASTIIELSKRKEKEGSEKNVVGNIIRAKTFKSRLSKENQEVLIRLYYDHRGLDKYYGLIELGEESGIIPRVGNRYEINGKKIGRNVIYANPEEYFTPELLEKLDQYAQKKFKYGSSLNEEPVGTEEDD